MARTTDRSTIGVVRAIVVGVAALGWSLAGAQAPSDHEPYGSGSEALAQRFGVQMNTSGTTDAANTIESSGGLVFTRECQLVVDHPITIGRDPSERINRVATSYGQALIGPVGTTAFLRFADTATYALDNATQDGGTDAPSL
jgi:hypothetical protein